MLTKVFIFMIGVVTFISNSNFYAMPELPQTILKSEKKEFLTDYKIELKRYFDEYMYKTVHTNILKIQTTKELKRGLLSFIIEETWGDYVDSSKVDLHFAFLLIQTTDADSIGQLLDQNNLFKKACKRDNLLFHCNFKFLNSEDTSNIKFILINEILIKSILFIPSDLVKWLQTEFKPTFRSNY